MIDEKKLISNLMEWVKESHDLIERGVVVDVLELIDDQPKADKWIPVSQDKPKTFETVLLAAKLPEEKGYLTYQGAREGTRYQLDGVTNDFDYIVAAWQPLPKKYEEVK